MEHIWEDLAEEANKTNCKKRSVACIIYDKVNKEVIGVGHNHHPDEVCDCGTTRTALHAEQMAVKNMKKRLKSQCIAFINHAPCSNCAKVLDKVVSEVRYRSQV
jgi:deoxycytidylate deaminase